MPRPREYRVTRKPIASAIPHSPYANPQKPGGLAKVFDILGRPAQAMHGLLTQPAGGFLAGLLGEHQGSFAQDLGKHGPLGVAAGLALDIGTDLTTYASLGVGPGAKLALRGGKLATLSKAGQKAFTAAYQTEHARILANLRRVEQTHRAAGALKKADAAAGLIAKAAEHPVLAQAAENSARRSLARVLETSPTHPFRDPGGIKFAGKSLVTGEQLRPLTDPIKKAAGAIAQSRPGQAILRTVTRRANPVATSQADEADTARFRSILATQMAKKDLQTPLAAYAKATGQKYDDVADQLYHAAEEPFEHTERRIPVANPLAHAVGARSTAQPVRVQRDLVLGPGGSRIDQLPAALRPLAQRLRAQAHELLGKESVIGTHELLASNPIAYILHRLTQAAREALGKANKIPGEIDPVRHASQLERDFVEHEILDPIGGMDYLRKNHLNAAPGARPVEFPITDPPPAAPRMTKKGPPPKGSPPPAYQPPPMPMLHQISKVA